MHKPFLLILLPFLLLACMHRRGPVISYEKKVINLGNIQFEKEYSGRILIRNTGDEPLVISNVVPDCSCTITDVGNKRILPNDTSSISFKITPAKDGFIQQNIFMDNNSVNESRVLFLLRANVKVTARS